MGEPLRNLDSDLVRLLSDCCIYLVAIDGQFTEREQAWVDWRFGDGTAQEFIEKSGSIQWDNFYGDLAQTISVLGETEITYLRTQAPGFFIGLLEVDGFGETEKQSLDELVKFINETIAEKEKATTDDEIVSSGEPRVEAPPELAVADSDTEDWHVTGVAPLPPPRPSTSPRPSAISASDTPPPRPSNARTLPIHVGRDNEEFGPYSLEEINAKLKDGTLLSTDEVWQDGMVEWVPIGRLSGVVLPGVVVPPKHFTALKEVVATPIKEVIKDIVIGVFLGVAAFAPWYLTANHRVKMNQRAQEPFVSEVTSYDGPRESEAMELWLGAWSLFALLCCLGSIGKGVFKFFKEREQCLACHKVFKKGALVCPQCNTKFS